MAPADTAFARHPQWIGPACAVGATGLGLAYLAAAGAPVRYVFVNAGALLVGLTIVAAGARWPRAIAPRPGLAILAIGAALLAAAFFGHTLEGATRWVRVGPLSLQPSLVLLPMMCVMAGRAHGVLAASGLIVAAIALALQPDRAMAGALVAGVAVLTLERPDRWRVAALAAAAVGFAVTLARPDILPAQPFVEQVFFSASQVHVLAGLVVWSGAVLLVIPAVVGAVARPDCREAYLAFGGVWLAVIAASALGNYPTPVVGYGASSILGYVLSLAALGGRLDR